MGWRFIDHRHLLPPAAEVPAWYDFASGFIGTAYTFAQTRLEAQQSGRDLDVDDSPIVTLIHEHAHFIQAITAPFLLHWSDTWANLASAPLRQIDPRITANEGLRAAMSTWDDPAHAAAAQQHLDVLFQAGVLGVDVFMLLESHATFLEVHAHTPAAGPDQVLRYLDQHAPSSAYRRAYDIVRLWCGDDVAYQGFHAIFLAAMTTSDPARAFDRLVFTCAEAHGDDLADFITDCATSWLEGLDTAAEHGGLGPHQQTYVPVARDWIDEIGARRLVADPRAYGAFAHTPVVVFGADDAHQFGIYPSSLSREEQDPENAELVAAFSWDYSVAALSQFMIRQRSQITVASVLDDGFAWLESLTSEVVELPIEVDNWGASTTSPRDLVEEALQRDAERVASAINGHDTQPSGQSDAADGGRLQIPSSLARRVVLFFETEDERDVWEIPEIGRFVAALHERVPWLPVLLRYPKHHDVLLVWFGNLVPAAVVYDGEIIGINVEHPDFLDALNSYIDAVFEATAPGMDLSPAVSSSLAAIMLSGLAHDA